MRVIPNTHLVMHGSSSCRRSGWRSSMSTVATSRKPTAYLSKKIVEGIKYGVRKVNIDTDLRLASTVPCARHMAKYPSENLTATHSLVETARPSRDVWHCATRPFALPGMLFQDQAGQLEACFARYAKR